MQDMNRDLDIETGYKETFRVFSKDKEGCIPPDEIKFVLTHLPGNIGTAEIEDMITTVDKNQDGKISYSEFRVMLGAVPLLIAEDTVDKPGDNTGQVEDVPDRQERK